MNFIYGAQHQRAWRILKGYLSSIPARQRLGAKNRNEAMALGPRIPLQFQCKLQCFLFVGSVSGEECAFFPQLHPPHLHLLLIGQTKYLLQLSFFFWPDLWLCVRIGYAIPVLHHGLSSFSHLIFPIFKWLNDGKNPILVRFNSMVWSRKSVSIPSNTPHEFLGGPPPNGEAPPFAEVSPGAFRMPCRWGPWGQWGRCHTPWRTRCQDYAAYGGGPRWITEVWSIDR